MQKTYEPVKEKPEDKPPTSQNDRVNSPDKKEKKVEKEPETAAEDSPLRSFSIKERLKKKETSDSTEIVDEKKEEYSAEDHQQDKENEFGEDDLMEAWSSFGDTLKSGNPRMVSIIKAMKPVIEDETGIILELSNKAQKDYFDQKYRNDVIKHLKKHLSNSKIQFRTRVSEKTEKSTPYTDEEKYKHLAKKNPAVDKLRNELGLDYD